MEPDGILNGSNRNERSRNTTTITGNKPAVQSSHQGCMSSRVRASDRSPSTWAMPSWQQGRRGAGHRLLLQRGAALAALGQEIEALGQPIQAGDQVARNSSSAKLPSTMPKYQAPA
jgi:hypothetical protein